MAHNWHRKSPCGVFLQALDLGSQYKFLIKVLKKAISSKLFKDFEKLFEKKKNRFNKNPTEFPLFIGH